MRITSPDQIPTTPVFTIKAYTQHGRPSWVEVTAHVQTKELAAEIAAQFPKSVNVRGQGMNWGLAGITTGWVSFRATLAANGVNGGRNETGIRRYHNLIKHLARLGHAVEYEVNASNSYPSREAFETAIA